MKLNELFRDKYEWHWSNKREWEREANFQTDGGELVRVHFDMTGDTSSNGPWQIDFDREQEGSQQTHATGQGDAFKIFATVNDIIEDFAHEVQPYSMVFHADEPTRQSLYKRVLPKMALRMGMHFKLQGDQAFWLFKEPPQHWHDE